MRGWEANQEDVWDQAYESGVNIVTTDKVMKSQFARVGAGGQRFAFPALTFKFDTGKEAAVSAPQGDFVQSTRVVEVHQAHSGDSLW